MKAFALSLFGRRASRSVSGQLMITANVPYGSEKMTEELKPCPFCGSDNVHLSHWTGQAYVYCANCMVRTEVYLHGSCEEKAIEAWNRRAERDREGGNND